MVRVVKWEQSTWLMTVGKSEGIAEVQYLRFGFTIRNVRNAQTSVVNICFR